jgi:antitoxin component YwqK of YwqJK toxin-antitoxin module
MKKSDNVIQNVYNASDIEIKNGYYTTKEGTLITGMLKTYDEGTLIAEEIYENGELNGISREYYESGALKSEGNYEDGEKIGIHKKYYETGILMAEENYENGKLKGVSREYYESGALKSEGNYEDGKETGFYKEYYESGALKSEGNYKNGKEVGIHKEYYETGILMAEENYENGRLEGTSKYFDKMGNMQEKINFSNGKLKKQKERLTPKIEKELEKYPYLHRYIRNYIDDTDEFSDHISDLVLFFRFHTDCHGVEPYESLDWAIDDNFDIGEYEEYCNSDEYLEDIDSDFDGEENDEPKHPEWDYTTEYAYNYLISGHNSAWQYVMDFVADEGINYIAKLAIRLAKKYGDEDISRYCKR